MEGVKCTDRVIEQILYSVIGCSGGDCIFYLDIETSHGWHTELLNSPITKSSTLRIRRTQEYLFGQTQVAYQSNSLQDVEDWIIEQHRLDWYMQFKSGLKVLLTLPHQVGVIL